MRLTLFLGLLLLSHGSALAKCPFARYAVEGALSLPPGVNANEVRVYLFLEGTQRTSEYPAAEQQQDFAIPKTDGTFHVEVWLSTLSGYSDLAGERCERVAKDADLFVIGPGIYAHRSKLTFDESKKEIRRALRASAKMKPLCLEALEPDPAAAP